MVNDGELEIPESNREIALHLRSINQRLTVLEKSVSDFHTSMHERRFRFQDILISSLIFPLIGGTLLFLLTKGL